MLRQTQNTAEVVSAVAPRLQQGLWARKKVGRTEIGWGMARDQAGATVKDHKSARENLAGQMEEAGNR
ncbi:MAG: hypothetical protein EBZ36_18785 [Acidobacteria bacterium]|nr:hypothetical protein [Acidobacteriota bacterium]